MRELILAIDPNGAIGIDGALGFSCPEDMQWFKWYTTNKTVCMGRATFESMGSVPLPKRKNLVVTRNPLGMPAVEGVQWGTLNDVLEMDQDESICFIGGAQIYSEVLSVVDRAVVTYLSEPIKDATVYLDLQKFDFGRLFNQYTFVKSISDGDVVIWQK